MKEIVKKISAVLLTGVMALSLLGGCAIQRKPLPPDANTPPAPAPAPNPNAPQRTPEETRNVVDNLELKVEAVPGIKDAYVAVVGNVALIGLNLRDTKQEQGTNQAKAQAVRVAEGDQRIVKAYVTSDPDLTTRIREVSDGIRQGRPITEFLDEISEIMNRLAPTGRRVPTEPAPGVPAEPTP